MSAEVTEIDTPAMQRPREWSSGRTQDRVWIGVLLAVVALAYGNSLWNGFTMDDIHLYVVRNAQVTSPSLHGLFTPHPATKVFRPLTFCTFALDWKLSGGRPFLFHFVNLILHGAVVFLLYALLRALLQGLAGGEAVAFAAALLFAVHPIHTEAVTSVVGRAELLAAGFVLAAWVLHLRDKQVPSLICFVLGLLSKESAIAFLPLVIIGDFATGKWKTTGRYLRIIGVSLLYLGLLWRIQGGHFGPANIPILDNPLLNLPVNWRILNALRIAWKYIGLQLYPASLSCDYSLNQIPLYLDLRHTVPAALATVAVVGAWIWAGARRRQDLVPAGGIYLASFAVVSNILMPIGTIMGERLVYFPSIGFCLLIALGWNWLEVRRREIAWALLVLVALGLGMRTVLRNRDWRDNLTLYSAAVRVVPRSAKVHEGLGASYIESGQLDLAARELQEALQINPRYPEAMEAYGLLQSWKGNYQEAGRMLEGAFYLVGRDNPNYDDMAVNLAGIYIQTNHLDGALSLLNREIAESPGYARAWANRAVVQYKLGNVGNARSDAEAALQLDPGNQQARNLLRVLQASPSSSPQQSPSGAKK